MKIRGDGRSQWNNQWGFIVAAVGSAIGLGNIWRFSYMAYENGGGAFLIPYLVALFTAGLPLLLLEFVIGHERVGSAPLAYAKIKERWEWLGWWAVTFVMFGIILYYVVVIAWCLNFFFLSFNLGWGADPNSFFFKDFLKVSGAPSEIGGIRERILLATVFIWFLNWLIVYRGVDRGIEVANKIFMPLLFLLTVVLVVWSSTLEGIGIGLKAYITPDFSKLAKPKVWIDAYSQIFYTLTLGFGIMIVYASYLPEKTNLSKSSLLIAFLNSGYSLFAGIATFSILGYMATQQGKEISEVVSQSIGLAFVAYPKALSLIPGGNIFGVIFFFCLVVAGLSSAISIIEAFVSAMIDKFDMNRTFLITVFSILGLLGSIIFTTEAGLLWLDIVDHFLTHYCLVAVGILECILVGWLFRLDSMRQYINRISSVHIGPWWNFLIKFFIPCILLVILIGNLYSELKEPYEGYTWSSLFFIGWTWIVITLIVAFILSSRPWRTNKRTGEGRSE